MSMRISAMIFAGLVVLAAPTARAADLTGSSVTVEAFGGWQSLNGSSVSAAVNSANQNNAILGGDVLFKAGLFGIGVALDKGISGGFQPWDGSVLLGLVLDVLPSLRLEALGEVGRRGLDFGDMFNSNGQTFLGVRPGVSFRLEPTPIRFGVAVPVRWRTSGPGADFGSPDYSVVGRVGVEFP